ncbi:RICIN domain-containing protein [Streptomyces sp. NBC_01077]|uniref:RICIN domain-containing protein n=1 Tax=Streptomyces sp. NBC_01077 TaxID=2903746 RepID=UPI0038689576|nr:RICIN domain-containing protein [Streptomyces sp. NBC_01077]
MRKRFAAIFTAATAVAGLGLSTAPAQAASVYNIEINIGNGYCLDIPNSQAYPGQFVQQWYCNGTDAQKWNVVDAGSQYFKVQSKAWPQYCLNNFESTAASGGHIKLYDCNDPTDSLFNRKGVESFDHLWKFQPKLAATTCVNMWGGDQVGAVARLFDCNDEKTNSYFDLWNVSSM